MNNKLIAAGIGALVVTSGCASFDRGRGAATDHEGRFYVGAGALISNLDPDTGEVDGTDVEESQSAGGNVLLGYDISNRFSLEGNYAALGAAELTPAGEIDYTVAGFSALVYGLNDSAARGRREGFSVFGRAGVGLLDNSSDDVEFEQVNDFNLLLGLGVEYGFGNGLGLRGEVIAHDEDVQYGQLALLYRFGDAGPRSRRAATRPEAPKAPDATPSPSSTPATRTTPAPAPAAPTARTALDRDRDGVIDRDDRCPDTGAGTPVDERGCDLFDGAIEGVTFESGSDTLTAGAQQVLNGVAETLAAYPASRIAIEAHTDNSGDADANLQLSRRRAISVARYLLGQGVAGDRLKPRAFGEEQPRVSNATPEGRAQNRRVEFRTVE